MARLSFAFAVISLLVAVFALVSCVRTPKEQVRFVPKWAWIVAILLFPALGGVLWLAVGRERTASRRPRRTPTVRSAPQPLPPLPPEPGHYSVYDHDARIRQIEEELRALEREADEGTGPGEPPTRA